MVGGGITETPVIAPVNDPATACTMGFFLNDWKARTFAAPTYTETGKVAGKESVLMYVTDLVASITPEAKRLRAFDKIELQPGQSKTVSFTITEDKLSFINNNLKRVTEPGDFKIAVGELTAMFKY